MNKNEIKARNRKISKTRDRKKWRDSIIKGRLEGVTRITALRKARSNLLLGQEKVAKALSTTTQTYCSIERAKRRVTKERAAEIARIVKAPLSKLFIETTDKKGAKAYLARRA